MPASDELVAWIVQALGEQLELDPQAIDLHERFSRYGLDSVGAIALTRRLAERLGRSISPVAVWRAPTPYAL
ncbi:MAG TPA: acyl carrier protein, partial [Kofleriaceae bacterium]|nr:acyl carrier protein [Kofleriaceae bacterium]